MKLKKALIRIESVDKLNSRWSGYLKGKKVNSHKGYEVISVSNWEVLGRLFSPPRLQLLAAIPMVKATSIAALAKAMRKDFKNVYSDVRFLADLGLIELKEEGPRKNLVPIAKYEGIEFSLAA
jgi:predicted transcriptional regulator